MFDETISDETIVVMPIIVLDIYYRLNDILTFTPLTNNFKQVLQNYDVSEIVLSSINIDNSASQYRFLFDNQYDQHLANSNYDQFQKIVAQERINFYKYAMEVYQLHYFSFSTGDNWELIMREQLKAQPSALTEKFRVGQIQGKLSVTKALTIQSKTIDNQTTVCGFLTVVLNYPFKFPADEPYTLFDSNMRYIAGLDDEKYQNGIKQILFQFNYIKVISVNSTIGNIQNVFEFNNDFWNEAFDESKQQSYTLIINNNKSTFQNLILESDYNKSEIHQRSVIFNANCDYFVSGQIVVKQLGAIDGLLIIYKDIILSNYSKEFKVVIANSIADVSNYYGNLNQRQQSTTFSTKYQFNNYNNSVMENYISTQEITVILYLMCIPIILLIILLFSKVTIQNQSFDYYESEDEKQLSISIEHKQNNQRSIQNQINILHNAKQEVLYYTENFLEFLSQQQMIKLIFTNDLQKYQFLQNGVIHEHIYQYMKKQSDINEQPNMFSFYILVSSQQYSIIMNGILRNKSWISNQYIKFLGSLQVRYNTNSNVSVLNSRNSRHTSRIQSRIMSSSNLLQIQNSKDQELNVEIYISKVFDDSNIFIDRNLNTPCKVSIFKFRSTLVNTLFDLLEQSKIIVK
ncbi:Conserved_hypothetical protein [Hexamita inflata]|nr:Conserved hypothetical protein [Hexamita inflata]